MDTRNYLTFDQLLALTNTSPGTLAKHLADLERNGEILSRKGTRWGKSGRVYPREELTLAYQRRDTVLDKTDSFEESDNPPPLKEGKTINEYIKALRKWLKNVRDTDGRGRPHESIPLRQGTRRVKYYYIPFKPYLPWTFLLEDHVRILLIRIWNATGRDRKEFPQDPLEQMKEILRFVSKRTGKSFKALDKMIAVDFDGLVLEQLRPFERRIGIPVNRA